MFEGASTLSVDAKGRIAIPTRYRDSLVEMAAGRLHTVLDDWRPDLWRLIAETPHLTWMLLTKRPQNVMGQVPSAWHDAWPENVWIGAVSTDDPFGLPSRQWHWADGPLAGTVFSS